MAKPARFPATLPPIWNVPYLRNPHFTGRDELLERLHRTLTGGPTVLSGMGGIGKTQLALEYTYRHHTEFDLVWWLRAEKPTRSAEVDPVSGTPTTLLADYAALAGELRLPEAEQRELAAVAQAVRRTLEERARWLLVFDNARNGDDLRDLLPRGGGGQVLITSRNPSWDRATPLEVPPLVRALSVAFLLKRTNQGDETTAATLAAELGDLPLALEQAAAFIVRRPMSLADYLGAFRAQREELWKREKPPQDYPDTVRTTWNLTAARLKQEEPGAIDLLNLGAFLAPEAIPRWLFAEHRDTLPPPLSEAAADNLRWGDFVEALRSYSLVGVGDRTVTFHRLVQAATRDGLPADDRRRWAEVAVRLVNAALPRPPEEHTNWLAIKALLPHALATAEAGERLEAGLEIAATVLNQTALYHSARAAWAEAGLLFLRSLKIREKVFGPESLDVAESLNNLAQLYWYTGRYAEAEMLFLRSLKIREKASGPESPALATGLHSLAQLYLHTGRYAEAEMLFLRSLAIVEKFSGPESATGLHSLAQLYLDTGRYAEAEPLFLRSLKIREKVFGLESPRLATGLNGLASLYWKTGRYAEAEPLFLRSLKIREKVSGPEHPEEHPDVAQSLNNLALLYRDTGRYAEAEPLFLRSLKILEKVFGPEHPELATTLDNLALLYRDTGRYAEAEPLFLRAMAIREKTLPPDHPLRMWSRENYAGLLGRLGRHVEAAALRAQTPAIR